MSDLNQDEIWNNRAAQIRRFCTEHDITKLLHYTRVENLRSILREGLLSRETLDSRGQQYWYNDQSRVVGYKNAICLSISFPNYKMFYSKREEKKKVEEVSDSHWVVLHIDAEVLWELDCALFQKNAASGRGAKFYSLEGRKKIPMRYEIYFKKNFMMTRK